MDIPDVKFCNTINMKCYVDLTTSFTTLIENPYTLNYYRLYINSMYEIKENEEHFNRIFSLILF